MIWVDPMQANNVSKVGAEEKDPLDFGMENSGDLTEAKGTAARGVRLQGLPLHVLFWCVCFLVESTACDTLPGARELHFLALPPALRTSVSTVR